MWSHVALSPERTAGWGLSPVPFPVRTARRDAVLGGEQVDLVALLGELDMFLTEQPSRTRELSDNASRLAGYLGTVALADGDASTLAAVAEVGLRHRPTKLQHHLHLALARHHLDDLEASLPHYAFVVDHPRADVDLLPRLLYAQALEELGRPLEAVLAIWPPPVGVELDLDWWGHACRLAQQAGIEPPSRPDRTRERQAIRDALTGVDGVTREVQEAVATRFGTLRALRCASAGQLAELDGVDGDDAHRILDAVRAPLLQGT